MERDMFGGKRLRATSCTFMFPTINVLRASVTVEKERLSGIP